MSVAALIPAAGSGTRLGLGPKALVELGRLSLLERVVAGLAPFVDEVIVALPAGQRQEGLEARQIGGGDTRQASVLALLQATEADFVLIHDAARPFLTPEVVHRVLEAAREVGASTAALPLADTLVRAGPEARLKEAVPREGLWAVQTPQGFERARLLAAHEQARWDGHAATDDAGLIARLGGEVRLVLGDARLFKVTTPGDLALARALQPLWDRGEA